jgi:hypothetical protein
MCDEVWKMKRYEYRSFLLKAAPGQKTDPIAELNKIGEDGWVALHFQVSPTQDQMLVVAYREKE